MTKPDDEWSICPYAVGLLLDAPDDVSAALALVYRSAEETSHRLGLPAKSEAARAIRAVYVQYSANEARGLDALPELADWLERAALILIADLGLDLAAFARGRAAG